MDFILLIFSIIAIFSAISVFFMKDLFKAALMLGVVLISVAVIYAKLMATFIAILQVLVYSGGILIMILFAVILMRTWEEGITVKKIYLIPATLFLVFLVPLINLGAVMQKEFTVTDLGNELFSRYIIHFEIAGLLLLLAMVGSVFVAKRWKE